MSVGLAKMGDNHPPLVPEYAPFESELVDISAFYEGREYDLNDPEQMRVAKEDRLAIARVISKLDAEHDRIKEPLSKLVTVIDSERKRIKDGLRKVQMIVKFQLDDHESKIQKKKDDLQRSIDYLISFGDCGEMTAEGIRQSMNRLDGVNITDDYDPRMEEARSAKSESYASLRIALVQAERAEAQAAEVERLNRLDKEAKRQAELDEAHERGKAEAAAAAAEKAVADKRKRLNEASVAEMKKWAKNKADELKEKARVADVQHRNEVEREIIHDLMAHAGLGTEDTAVVLDALKGNQIAHVIIKY